MDQQNIYLEMFKEWRTHVRHHETQRSSITGFCLAFAGLMAKVAEDYHAKDDWFGIGTVGWLLIMIGLSAALLNQKQYERIRSALENSDILCEAIDCLPVNPTSNSSLLPLSHENSSVIFMRKAAMSNHKQEFPRLTGLKLHHVYLSLPLLVAIVGCVLAVWAFFMWNRFELRVRVTFAILFAAIAVLIWLWKSSELRRKTTEMDGVRQSRTTRRRLQDFEANDFGS